MNNVSDYPATGYRIDTQPLTSEVVAKNGKSIIATSKNARVMYETRLPPVIYFPMEDIKATIRENPTRRTFCPFKGTASYYDIEIDGKIFEYAAWSYKKALPDSIEIENLVAFSSDLVSQIDLSNNILAVDNSGNISGPTLDWLMREAWLCASPEEFTQALAKRFIEDGIAISRMSVMIWSLHPQIIGKNYIWSKDTDDIVVFNPSHDLLDNDSYINSPMRHVTNGLGGVRQQLTIDDMEFDFPIIADLKSAGATDYVAMPLPFSNGQNNVLTLTCDHRDGFTTANLGLIFECSTVISRFYEVFALKFNASSLLETYLGKRTGARVLGGEIRRGDGDEIDAAILFCDLRGSTLWEETLGRKAYLNLLNSFFELSTDIVNAHEGEVLKFIGDAILAIFPSTSGKDIACGQALDAAQKISDEIGGLDIPGSGQKARCAIGVTFGNVTYGNVGSSERLDFTVIGSSANIAARLGELGKEIGHPVLVSSDIATAKPELLTTLGNFDLRNVSHPVEAFVPA